MIFQINIELLVRSLKCSYEEFNSEVIEKDANKVIFEEIDELGNILYRTHHRIIARRTIEAFFGDPEIQKKMFIEILGESNLSNRKEREICEKLMVQHIGPNARPEIFTKDQQRQIFKIVCERNPVRSLVHHWGVLEADAHNYDEALRLLKWALEIPRDDIESYRGESDQNIQTSLGTLYSHIGIDLMKKGDTAAAEEYFREAETSFQVAKHTHIIAIHICGILREIK